MSVRWTSCWNRWNRVKPRLPERSQAPTRLVAGHEDELLEQGSSIVSAYLSCVVRGTRGLNMLCVQDTISTHDQVNTCVDNILRAPGRVCVCGVPGVCVDQSCRTVRPTLWSQQVRKPVQQASTFARHHSDLCGNLAPRCDLCRGLHFRA